MGLQYRSRRKPTAHELHLRGVAMGFTAGVYALDLARGATVEQGPLPERLTMHVMTYNLWHVIPTAGGDQAEQAFPAPEQRGAVECAADGGVARASAQRDPPSLWDHGAAVQRAADPPGRGPQGVVRARHLGAVDLEGSRRVALVGPHGGHAAPLSR